MKALVEMYSSIFEPFKPNKTMVADFKLREEDKNSTLTIRGYPLPAADKEEMQKQSQDLEKRGVRTFKNLPEIKKLLKAGAVLEVLMDDFLLGSVDVPQHLQLLAALFQFNQKMVSSSSTASESVSTRSSMSLVEEWDLGGGSRWKIDWKIFVWPGQNIAMTCRAYLEVRTGCDDTLELCSQRSS